MAKHAVAKLTVKISHSMLAFYNKIAGWNLSAGTDRGCEALAFYKCSYFIKGHTFRLKPYNEKSSNNNLSSACEDYKK